MTPTGGPHAQPLVSAGRLPDADVCEALRAGQPVNFAPFDLAEPEPPALRAARTISAACLAVLGDNPATEVASSITIAHAVIDGDWRLRHATFQRPIRITDTIFTGQVDLSFATFKQAVSFAGCLFLNGLTLRAARFTFGLELQRATFPVDDDQPERARAVLRNIQIGEALDARGATFGEVDFVGAQVASEALFSPWSLARADDAPEPPPQPTCFRGRTRFVGTRFMRTARFQRAEFDREPEFYRAVFDADADFRGAVFKCGANFISVQIEGSALFGEAKVELPARFGAGPDGTAAARFHNAQINGPAAFQRVRFEGPAEFFSAQMKAEARFDGAQFVRSASFDSVHIDGQVNFEPEGAAVSFGGFARFSSAHIQGHASFNQVTFGGDADFYAASFGADVRFRGATFQHAALFDQIQVTGQAHYGPQPSVTPVCFLSEARFVGAQFGGPAYFQLARFGQTATFARARFQAEAFFDGAQFGCMAAANESPVAEFNRVVIEGPAFFRAYRDEPSEQASGVRQAAVPVRFCSEARFVGVRIGGATNFEQAEFADKADFYAATFGADAYFNGALFACGPNFVRAEIAGGAFFRPYVERADGAAGEHDKAYPVRFGARPEKGKPTATLFINAHIKGAAEFHNARFEGPAQFFRADLGGDVTFNGARFEGCAAFDGIQIEGSVFFQPDGECVRFEQKARFNRAHVKGGAFFSEAQFQGTANFDNVHVDGPAYFDKGGDQAVLFKHTVRFDSAVFGADANFGGAQFLEKARFNGARFRKRGDFDGAQFGDEADFTDSTVDGEASFVNARFSSKATFRDARFHVALFRARLTRRRVADNEPQFVHGAEMRGFGYERIRVAWEELFNEADPEQFDRQPYMQLEGSLRAVGEDRQAEDLYLWRRDYERNQLLWRRDKKRFVTDSIHWLVARYGVQPYQLLVLFVVVLVIGTVVFSRPEAVSPKVTGVPGIAAASAPPAVTATTLSLVEAFGVSLNLLMPVELPAGSQWKPSENMIRLGADVAPLSYAAYATGHRLAGWILVPLGVLAISGLLRRPARL